ncbi:MAG: putative lipid II flippase FtsW [Pseudomonadota bacterium]
MISRANRGTLAEWWWTVDRWLLFSIIALISGGLVLSLAASPPVAERIGVGNFHFVQRHVIFLIPALLILFGVSLLNLKQARRAAFAMFLAAVAALILTMFIGFEVKGARRWISLGVFSLQASEFAKPAFVVVCAWLFAEQARKPGVPGNLMAIILLAIMLALLMVQPDLGQSVLVVGVWAAMFFMAGIPWIWIIGLAGLAVVGLFGAYFSFSHVSGRIDRFITGAGDTFQVDTGREAIIRGGWLGQGPGEGTVKRVLPDSHTDFIFAVAAEEFGILICLALLGIFAFIVVRGLLHALSERDEFVKLAVSGLVLLFGMQSIINMAVNLQLMPAKGMTLPFISYGGSSLIAMAFGMGLVLALTRNRPDALRHRDVEVGSLTRFAGA